MWTSLKTVFGIDLRTLALVRVMLGVALLVDLINRWPNLAAFYTDAGIWPRKTALVFNDPARWSLFYISGLPWVIHVLFAALALCALALIYGYRTRLATIAAWVLFASLANRNLIIQQGGDTLLCLLLFWGIFLPMGARFSLDDALRKEHAAAAIPAYDRSHAYVSVATAALLLQASYVYCFGALLKTSPVWTEDYTALYYALSLESVTTTYGEWLKGVSWLLKPLTRFVYWLELLMPLYMFTPFLFLTSRLTGLVLLISMHLGFVVFLSVGIFPLISIISLLAFLPGSIWDWLENRFGRRQVSGPGWTLFYDEGCGFCRKTCLILRSFCLPYAAKIIPAQSDPIAGPILEREASWVVETPEGTLLTSWPALLRVLKASPITALKAWCLSFLPSRWGAALYDWIGERRAGFSHITNAVLPYRKGPAPCGMPVMGVVGLLAAFVLLWNVSTLKSSGLDLGDGASSAAKFLRLRQAWNMFAAAPATLEGHYALVGTLKDGSLVNLWTGEPGFVSIQPPADLKQWYGDYRWRKVFERIHKKSYRQARIELARYWCRQSWTNQDGDLLGLKHVHMTFYGRYTQPDGRPDREKDYLLYNKDCP